MKNLSWLLNFLNMDSPEFDGVVIEGKWEGGDFWQKQSEVLENGMMDISGSMWEEEECIGFNFSGRQRLLELFFGGSCDSFYAIAVGEENPEDIPNIDQYPVYFIETDVYDNKELVRKPLGNLRDVLLEVVEEFLEKYTLPDEYTRSAKILQKRLQLLSSHCISDENYILKLVDENE